MDLVDIFGLVGLRDFASLGDCEEVREKAPCARTEVPPSFVPYPTGHVESEIALI